MSRNPENGRYLPGGPGGPGRPKGSRDSLSRDFLDQLAADFKKHGKGVIQTVRTERPAHYLRVIASLQPKEIEIRTPESDLSDDQVEQLYMEMLARMKAKETKRDILWQ